MVPAVLSNVPSAVAEAAPAALMAEVHCDRAELAFVLAVFAVPCAVDAFVSAVDALVLAVFDVEVTAAAAVFTLAAVLPVDDPPANAWYKLSQVV